MKQLTDLIREATRHDPSMFVDVNRHPHVQAGLDVDAYVDRSSWAELKRSYPKLSWDSRDVIDQHKRLADLGEPHYTKMHRKIARDYTSYSSDINYGLIHNRDLTKRSVIDPPQYDTEGHLLTIQRKVHHLDDMIRSYPKLPEDVHVYSAMHVHPAALAKHRIFQTKAYTSTSINPRIAQLISSSNAMPKDKQTSRDDQSYTFHIAHFHLPEGYDRAAYIAKIGNGNYANQREMLIGRNSKFQIVNHFHDMDKHGNRHHIWSMTPAE